ncbi:class I SAM-dependent methyltransferase [uncultured Psychroserpens sp.]|uniref:THUMP-like domain-containing protein n=1 Tax=uncultured Psychroserpens sp. TaxID=255436 RepID=UPI002607705B|nr:class I SAM-dependent methyltransferase [uncultured Psychroserpens sp.]
MNKNVLNTEVQNYINTHLNDDITKLLLKGKQINGIDIKIIIEQIEAKKKSKTKLPTWFETKNIYYPNKLNIEQTSSELTAKYKSSLISGERLIDITGGFGVDSYYFSKNFSSVTHCEINDQLSKIVSHNFKQLEVKNISCISEEGINHLNTATKTYDWIYIDPSRRHESKGKVFFLRDCLPNVPKHLETIMHDSNNVMIKTSPLLDLSIGISELKYVKQIHIVALNNEVKELLWILEKDHTETTIVKTVNFTKGKKQLFSFKLEDEPISKANYSLPLTYLFEPNVAILKSGGFKVLSDAFKIYKLHKNSHLYTSNSKIEFPGKQFKIEKIISYNKRVFKYLGISKANVVTRNFPETVQQIRKKLGIKDGGETYLFFTTNLSNEKLVLVCSRI